MSERVDCTVEIDAPYNCPHCEEKTDLSKTDTTSFIQENIVLRPQTVVTTYLHTTAYCLKCRRQVIRVLENELPFTPIGPNAKAAKVLLGNKLKGLLVTDAYAAYNTIETSGRQSCLAHLLRKARELGQLLEAMEHPDQASARLCNTLVKLFKMACIKKIPAGKKDRATLKKNFLRTLDLICESSVAFPKAETLRKRLIPGAREHDEVFTFIEHDARPPTTMPRELCDPWLFSEKCLWVRAARRVPKILVSSRISLKLPSFKAAPLSTSFLPF